MSSFFQFTDLPDQYGLYKELIELMIANNPQERIHLNEAQTKLNEIVGVYDASLPADCISPEEDGQLLEERPDWLM